MFITSAKRGDTLIEVLLATSILAFVVAGTSVIMNRGLGNSQLSLERTQVQAEIAGQGSVLRAMRDSAVKQKSQDAVDEWQAVTAKANSSDSTQQQAVCNAGSVANDKRFYFPTSGDVSSWAAVSDFDQSGGIKPKLDYLPQPGDGLWVEAYYYPASVPYYDFYIKACWDGSGYLGQQEEKTVVRLYANL